MTTEHNTTYSAESFALLQREIDRLLSENNALRMAMGLHNQEMPEPDPLRAAVERLRGVWDRLSACVDEFEPEDMQACGEHRDQLDGAILAVLNAAKDGPR
jgi:hypothetical protein